MAIMGTRPAERTSVKRSLSLYLSFTQDSCEYLPAQVSLALEMLGELDANFELVLVDRTGSEATSELAQELAATYPQVRAAVSEAFLADLPYPVRKGQRPSGHIALVADADAGIRAGDLRGQFASARTAKPAMRTPRWGQRLQTAR